MTDLKNAQGIKVLRIKDVITRTGLSRSGIYDRMKVDSRYYDASFPTTVKLGKAAVGWKEAEVEAWIASRFDRNRSDPPHPKRKIVQSSSSEYEPEPQEDIKTAVIENPVVIDQVQSPPALAVDARAFDINGIKVRVSRRKSVWVTPDVKKVEKS